MDLAGFIAVLCFCIAQIDAFSWSEFSYDALTESTLSDIRSSDPQSLVTGVLAPSASKQYHYTKDFGDGSLLVLLESHTGDADLYVRYSQDATVTDYDLKSDVFQSDFVIIPPKVKGKIYLLVHGSASSYSNASYSLSLYRLPAPEDEYLRIVHLLGHDHIPTDNSGDAYYGDNDNRYTFADSEKKSSDYSSSSSSSSRGSQKRQGKQDGIKKLVDVLQTILKFVLEIAAFVLDIIT